jgi:hypothetical protein
VIERLSDTTFSVYDGSSTNTRTVAIVNADTDYYYVEQEGAENDEQEDTSHIGFVSYIELA